MEELGSRIFAAGKDWVFASVGSWLHWLISLVMQTIGWPGIIALAASTLLLISLSTRAVRFLHSVKGMAVTAAVALIAAGLTWWTWPAPALAEPAAMLASASPAATEPAELAEAAPAAVIEAVKALEPPPLERIAARTAARAVLPPLPFVAVAPPVVPQPPPLTPAPHVAPIVVATPAHNASHHVNKPSHPAFGQTRASSAAVVSHPVNRGGFASAGGSGYGHGFNAAASHHRPTIHDYNNAAIHGQGPFAGPMMGMGSFAHPMHMGGVHPGMMHGVHHGHH